jgi:hypothetical protein
MSGVDDANYPQTSMNFPVRSPMDLVILLYGSVRLHHLKKHPVYTREPH